MSWYWAFFEALCKVRKVAAYLFWAAGLQGPRTFDLPSASQNSWGWSSVPCAQRYLVPLIVWSRVEGCARKRQLRDLYHACGSDVEGERRTMDRQKQLRSQSARARARSNLDRGSTRWPSLYASSSLAWKCSKHKCLSPQKNLALWLLRLRSKQQTLSWSGS